MDGQIILNQDDLLIIGSLALIVLVVIAWRLFYVAQRSSSEYDLSDGAVLIAIDGRIHQMSDDASALLGDCQSQSVADVLGQLFPEDRVRVRDAIGQLEITGSPVYEILRTADNTAYEVIGKPYGALLRLVLREASGLDQRLREASARIEAAESLLTERSLEQETLSALIADAPIITWRRTAEGKLIWSAGKVRTRSALVTAAQTVDLIVARARLSNRQLQVVGQPQKSRVEVVADDSAETISLHVAEIMGPDNTRLGFATDAGTAAAAERTLTRFVQTMTETFAHLTVGLAIFDRNQTLALFNPALVQMWQVEPAWLARRPSLRDIIDELRATRRLPELKDFHKWRDQLLNLFDNTEAADYEELWHLADGSNIRVLARPHPHGSLAFIFDDVTERMKLEQRYRHSIDLRRATLDRLNEGIAVFGANGLLEFANQAFHQIWDIDSETVHPAMHARQLVGLCEQLTVETEVWRRLYSFITGEESRRAWTARLTIGSGRILTARFAPLPDGSTMAVFSDITDSERIALALHERNEALEVSEEMRSAVLDQLSQKLHAPLERILDVADAIGNQDVGSGSLPLSDQAEEIASAARDALDAMKDVTELSSLALEGIENSTIEIDLAEAVMAAHRLLERRAEEAGVVLTVDVSAYNGHVFCDPTRLRQIIFNLAADAIQCCDDGGRVILGAALTDTGFSVFTCERPPLKNVQARPSVERASRTLGLVRRLVEREGGEINIGEGKDPPQVRVVCTFNSSALSVDEDSVPGDGRGGTITLMQSQEPPKPDRSSAAN